MFLIKRFLFKIFKFLHNIVFINYLVNKSFNYLVNLISTFNTIFTLIEIVLMQTIVQNRT